MDSRLLRGLIESENARTMTREDLISTFVPTESFWRLLNPKNHVVIGSRGSGKTALAKMLSHEYLTGLAARGEQLAERAIQERSFIGVYVSTKAEWVGSLKNKAWQTPREKEEFFRWRLNLASCIALLRTIRSCLDTYVHDAGERFVLERDVITLLGEAWLSIGDTNSIRALTEKLEDVEYQRHLELTSERVNGATPTRGLFGAAFDAELFAPLKRGITLFKRLFSLPENAKWIFCLDEAEFLEYEHHRILNSHMRSDSQDLAFKITTTPYRHLTLETNTGAPLRVNDDFEYVYIDQEKRTEEDEQDFAESLFRKLADRLGPEFSDLTLTRLLGRSDLLESKSSQWRIDSPEMHLLEQYATPELWRRAIRLYNTDEERFRNEIVRKVHGLLKLRHAVQEDKGNRNFTAYAGAKMIVRCGDGNPRRLLRMLNALVRALDSDAITTASPLVPASRQSDVMIRFSSDALDRTKSEGVDLYTFLKSVGEFMQADFHNHLLSGDVVSAIEVDSSTTDEEWKLISDAVETGLLFPAVNRSYSDVLPIKSGRFHLANVLAPRFRLLPRRGQSRKLRTLLSASPIKGGVGVIPGQFQLWGGDD